MAKTIQRDPFEDPFDDVMLACDEGKVTSFDDYDAWTKVGPRIRKIAEPLFGTEIEPDSPFDDFMHAILVIGWQMRTRTRRKHAA